MFQKDRETDQGQDDHFKAGQLLAWCVALNSQQLVNNKDERSGYTKEQSSYAGLLPVRFTLLVIAHQ
jgi:hypothetical protein